MIVYKSEGKKINEQRKVNRVWSYFFFFEMLAIIAFHSISRLLTTKLDNIERARSTLIELDNSFTLSPRCSSSPSSMLGKLDREVELDYSSSMVSEDRAWVDFELGINISSTVSRGRLLIELGWHVELDEPLLSSVAHITKLTQLSYNC